MKMFDSCGVVTSNLRKLSLILPEPQARIDYKSLHVVVIHSFISCFQHF